MIKNTKTQGTSLQDPCTAKPNPRIWSFQHLCSFANCLTLSTCQAPSKTVSSVKAPRVCSALHELPNIYCTAGIPWPQECVPSLAGWKAAQQSTTESTPPETPERPAGNELTHRRSFDIICFRKVSISMDPASWIFLNLYDHERKIELCSNAVVVAAFNDLMEQCNILISSIYYFVHNNTDELLRMDCTLSHVNTHMTSFFLLIYY